ncbi:MAG: divergent polysaccharide deacetylase family protein, partial [Pseudomonadota bacterium]
MTRIISWPFVRSLSRRGAPSNGGIVPLEKDLFPVSMRNWLRWPVFFAIGVLFGISMGVGAGLPTAGVAKPISSPSVEVDLLSRVGPQAGLRAVAKSLGHRTANVPKSRRLAQETPVTGLDAFVVNLGLMSETRATDVEPHVPPAAPRRPKIAVVIDDLGLSWSAFRAANSLPGPITLAFLPYGNDAQAMLDATHSEHEVMLHLPMEPRSRVADAGPTLQQSPIAISGAGEIVNPGPVLGDFWVCL